MKRVSKITVLILLFIICGISICFADVYWDPQMDQNENNENSYLGLVAGPSEEPVNETEDNIANEAEENLINIVYSSTAKQYIPSTESSNKIQESEAEKEGKNLDDSTIVIIGIILIIIVIAIIAAVCLFFERPTTKTPENDNQEQQK